MENNTLLKDDIVVFGLLSIILYLIFYLSASKNKILSSLFTKVPSILWCYLIPGLLNSFNIISSQDSEIYAFSSSYLLPACLVLFTINLDTKTLRKLGYKAILVFFAGTLGIILGGPIAAYIVKSIYPNSFLGIGDDEIYRGLATIAGSWIGGGANQTALKEVFQPSNFVFSQAVAVDIIVAETWLAILLLGVGKKEKLNKWLGADGSIINKIQERLANISFERKREAKFIDYLSILAVGFGTTGFAYLIADLITPWIVTNYPNLIKFSLGSKFFWVVSIATLAGVILSRTKVKNLEDVGASKIASLFLYILIASIGMQMNLFAILDNWQLILIGLIWISIHAFFVISAAKLLKVPFFFAAVGSQANVGGAASASVVAAAYHPSLVSVGVLLSVLGYVVGTYGGYICALLIKWVLQ